MALGWWLGGAKAGGRAELDTWLALHPAALFALIVAVASQPASRRITALGIGLLLALSAELALVTSLGAPPPLGQALRAALAGLVLGLALDGAVRLGRALDRRAGPALGAVAALALLFVPGVVDLHERLVLTPEPIAAADRPAVALLTGLPLVWGESGPSETVAGNGNATLRALARRLRIVPVPNVESLASSRLALIVQPRPPGPAGLVALDVWVRRGGRAVLLLDPSLRWSSALPLGDPRRPPLDAGLSPLLAHWGVRLHVGGEGVEFVRIGQRRLALPAPGWLSGCGGEGIAIACTIGRGRVLIVADADLIDDRAWTGPGTGGDSRAHRLADNPAFIAAMLDRLAGRTPDPSDRVIWATTPHI
ncbi:hypothetical protein [Sphingomonas jatrophae]|uniref:ABC transporter n=1 Tax=Sphingomonas jatrophae TaxID=1166337 RepID=A0A1I6M7B8_9SPHN|nr:hypothetical protein [Sphingomonas jatrophae]SFS11412.1 hypothetical protein SAMN05192580_3577 [Sphingomonas jatrophae]